MSSNPEVLMIVVVRGAIAKLKGMIGNLMLSCVI